MHAAVRSFVEAINRHAVDDLLALMTDDHAFIDAEGTVIAGPPQAIFLWRRFFQWFPDYEVVPTDAFQAGDVSGLFGTVRGTYALEAHRLDERRWEMPAAWRVVAREGKVAEWRVYCDPRPVYRLIGQAMI